MTVGRKVPVTKLENILLVRLSAIGDVVNCLPALRLLKKEYPDVRVTWAVERSSASLLEGDRDVDEVFVVKRREWTRGILKMENLVSLGGAFRALRERGFDVTLDFQGNLRSGLVAFASGARLRVGFTAGRVKEFCHIFYTRHVYLPRTAMHRVRKNLLLLEALGIKPELLPAGLKVAPADGEAIKKFIGEKNIQKKRIVILHPGVSSFGAFKQWPREGFAEVARKLARRKRLTVVVTWGPGERLLAGEIVRLSDGAALLGPEPRGLRELAYLLKQSAMFVSGDTGPLHIAAAVGTPVVGLYGPKDPAVYGPVGERHVVVRKDIECSPCQLRSCPETRCMKLITPDEVYRACRRILG